MTIHVQPVVRPEACPALVLNADYRPLSYYPLSLWCWQDAIKAVFLERVNIVSEYDKTVRSPSFEMRLPSRRLAEDLRQADAPSRLHAIQRLPARPLHLPVLRRPRGSDLRPSRPALEGRAHDLGERRRRLLALQSQEGRPAARARSRCGRARRPSRRPLHDLHHNGRLFPPNYLHESWMDYLYWDTELEP